jgi:hypothetical protein
MIILIAASCLPAQAEPREWAYADLRALNPVNSASPGHNLVAIYLRHQGRDLQIRLDLLETGLEVDYDLYLAISNGSSGTRHLPLQGEASLDWNILVSFLAEGQIRAKNDNGSTPGGLRLRIQRDPFLDTVVISMNREALGGSRQVAVQAFLAPKGSDIAASSIGPVRSDGYGASIPAKAQVLLVFWNTFPAATPAQALRRWDGAHSGPDSTRHGLRRLLDAVENTRQPVTLLDIKTPLALSALNYSGDLERLRRLVQSELVALPDSLTPYTLPPETLPGGAPFPLPEWALAHFQEEAQQVNDAFRLPPSAIRYTPHKPVALDYWREGLIFSGSGAGPIQTGKTLADEREISSITVPLTWMSGAFVLELPVGWAEGTALSASPWQASLDGPSLEVRMGLVQAAAAGKPLDKAMRSFESPQVLVLGGSLPETTWGDRQAAQNTLRYLTSRPWIEVLSAQKLRLEGAASLPASTVASLQSSTQNASERAALTISLPSEINNELLNQSVLEELRSAPNNPATLLAWQMVYSLLAPVVPAAPSLPALRAAYQGQIGHLLEAARWGDDPITYGEVNACEKDLDWDGQPECILASANFFAVFKKEGGYVSTAFVDFAGSLYQVIGPSSQFVVGLGDPSSWNTSRGIAGDPGQLRGAFSEIPMGYASPSWEIFTVEPFQGGLAWINPSGDLHKTFRLEEGALRVSYVSLGAVRVQIPLAIGAQHRFAPGWAGRFAAEKPEHLLNEAWSWGLLDGPRVLAETTAALSAQAFNDAQAEAQQPEDPNASYPAGHFLPFPMALVEVNGDGEFEIVLRFSEQLQPVPP